MSTGAVSPGQYRIKCPHCANGMVATARSYWVLRGQLFTARYGSRTIVSCEECYPRLGWQELNANASAGWWSVPWGLATPFVILQNFLEIHLTASRAFLEYALGEAGIDAESVRVNSRGLTGEQQRLVDALFLVANRAVLADGHMDERELALAVRIASQISGGRLSADEIIDGLLLASATARLLDRVNAEQAHLLLRVAFDISIADGLLQPTERAFLDTLATELRLPSDAVDALISAARRRRTESGPKGEASPRKARTKLEEALEILEIRDPTDLAAITGAYRRQMLKHHPDRAGADPARQKQFTERAQRLNWARDYLLS